MNPLATLSPAVVNLTDRAREAADRATVTVTDGLAVVTDALPDAVTTTIPTIIDQFPAVADRLPEALKPPKARWTSYTTSEAILATFDDLDTPLSAIAIAEYLQSHGRIESADKVEMALQLLLYRKLVHKQGPALWAVQTQQG